MEKNKKSLHSSFKQILKTRNSASRALLFLAQTMKSYEYSRQFMSPSEIAFFSQELLPLLFDIVKNHDLLDVFQRQAVLENLEKEKLLTDDVLFSLMTLYNSVLVSVKQTQSTLLAFVREEENFKSYQKFIHFLSSISYIKKFNVRLCYRNIQFIFLLAQTYQNTLVSSLSSQ